MAHRLEITVLPYLRRENGKSKLEGCEVGVRRICGNSVYKHFTEQLTMCPLLCLAVRTKKHKIPAHRELTCE